jgi:hypothetical protein
MIYIISQIEYDKGHDGPSKTLTMSSTHRLNSDELACDASEFISEKTGFCHEGFCIDLLELYEGKSYTFSNYAAELIYMGYCDESSKCLFAKPNTPDVTHMSIEGYELLLIKPFTLA